MKARISTRSSTCSSARLMLSATRPKSAKANRENAIVVTLSMLRSGERRTERAASRTATLMPHHLRRQSHLLQDARDPRSNLVALGADHLERERDVRLGCAVLQQAEILEHDAQLPPQARDHAARLELGRGQVAHPDLAIRRQF